MITDDRALGCVDGIHDDVVALPPVDLGTCVNVDHVCADCHVVVWTISYTKIAWLAEQAKAAARSTKRGRS